MVTQKKNKKTNILDKKHTCCQGQRWHKNPGMQAQKYKNELSIIIQLYPYTEFFTLGCP